MTTLDQSTPATKTKGCARDALLRIAPPTKKDWHGAASTRRRTTTSQRETGHSLAWLMWIIGASTTTLQTTNPLYLLIVWGCALLVWSACATGHALARVFGILIRLGGFIFFMHIVFSVFTAGFLRGQTVLLVLPTWTLPRLLGGLQIGGIVTLEQIVNGAAYGLRLWTLLMVVGAFNACVNHYRLLRYTPRFLFHAGLIITIGLVFVPQTVLRLQAIRESQQLRGHRFRSWRDALPLFIPLLSGGLERSLALAEAMEARGYGHTLHTNADTFGIAQRTQWLAFGGLAFLMIGCFGFLFYVDTWQVWVGLTSIGVGICLILGSWWKTSKGLTRSTYSRERWTHGSLAVGICAFFPPLTLWLLDHAGSGILYQAYPKVAMPLFDPFIGIMLLSLAAPALCLARRHAKQKETV